MAKIRSNLKSPIGATSARRWQPQLEKHPSQNFRKGLKNGTGGGGVPYFRGFKNTLIPL
jgi:hypothetical protein